MAQTVAIESEANILQRVKNNCGVEKFVRLEYQHGYPFLITEWVIGSRICDTKANIYQAAYFIRSLSETVSRIHNLGVIHNDITPFNIIIRDHDSLPVLVDFELAIHGNGHVCYSFSGTPSYMSPEKRIEQDVTKASDQYSFALVCYEVLFGVSAWGLPDVSTVPKNLREVFIKALSRSPKDRFPSVLAFGKTICELII